MRKKILFLICLIFFLTCSLSFGDESIVIKGSTTMLPISQKIAETYMAEYPEVKISISGGGSGNGIKALIDNITDIAYSSRFIKTGEAKMAFEKGIYPVPFSIAYDCIIPVVHPENSITDISIEQLKDIYTGKIKNWKDIGGDDNKLVVISRDTSSGTYEVWEEKVMNKKRVYAGSLLQASNGAVVQTVSKNKNAIGYIGIGYLNNQIKALKVNGIAGSETTTLDGSYLISRPLFIFTGGWPDGELMKFINYTLHPEKGQSLIRELGFIPLY